MSFHDGADVSVAAGQTATLDPGTYGLLHVSGTAYLSPGSYSFTAVTVDPHASLFASPGAVTMNVNGQLVTGQGSVLQGQLASYLTIAVGGTDVSTTPSSAVSIGSQSQITALVTAPRGTISLGDMTVATGALRRFRRRRWPGLRSRVLERAAVLVALRARFVAAERVLRRSDPECGARRARASIDVDRAPRAGLVAGPIGRVAPT
jgi:hypothetical protein